MLRIQENHRLPGMLEAQLTRAMEAAALEAAIGLRGRLSYLSSKRTGRKYPRYKRRSSAKGQYPQEQSGDLRASVDAAPLAALSAIVGVNTSDGRKIRFLERTGDARGRGVRRPLFMYFEGRDRDYSLSLMARAIRRELK